MRLLYRFSLLSQKAQRCGISSVSELASSWAPLMDGEISSESLPRPLSVLSWDVDMTNGKSGAVAFPSSRPDGSPTDRTAREFARLFWSPRMRERTVSRSVRQAHVVAEIKRVGADVVCLQDSSKAVAQDLTSAPLSTPRGLSRYVQVGPSVLSRTQSLLLDTSLVDINEDVGEDLVESLNDSFGGMLQTFVRVPVDYSGPLDSWAPSHLFKTAPFLTVAVSAGVGDKKLIITNLDLATPPPMVDSLHQGDFLLYGSSGASAKSRRWSGPRPLRENAWESVKSINIPIGDALESLNDQLTHLMSFRSVSAVRHTCLCQNERFEASRLAALATTGTWLRPPTNTNEENHNGSDIVVGNTELLGISTGLQDERVISFFSNFTDVFEQLRCRAELSETCVLYPRIADMLRVCTERGWNEQHLRDLSRCSFKATSEQLDKPTNFNYIDWRLYEFEHMESLLQLMLKNTAVGHNGTAVLGGEFPIKGARQMRCYVRRSLAPLVTHMEVLRPCTVPVDHKNTTCCPSAYFPILVHFGNE